MFATIWRAHWGLQQDPFAGEDADKDTLLDEVDLSCVHSGFDRLFGSTKSPAPGVVFGEKGSGKSGLRRMMRRKLSKLEEERPEERVLAVEYADFDGFLECAGRAVGASGEGEKAAKKTLDAWRTADHLDALLSLSVTELVERALGDEKQAQVLRGLPRKQRLELLLMTALYHHAPGRTLPEACAAMGRSLKLHSLRAFWMNALVWSLSALSVALVALPFLGPWDLPRTLFFWLGALCAAGTWGARTWGRLRLRAQAERASRSVRVLPPRPEPLSEFVSSLAPRERAELNLPEGGEEATRFESLRKLIDLLEQVGCRGLWVLVDRIDEPALLAGDATRMARFVESLLDIKLLQFPGLALKLFLPVELEYLERSSGPEARKRMRLDKSNLVPLLEWSGEELYAVACQRMAACTAAGEEPVELAELFGSDVGADALYDTLHRLGTPRYAFGFLAGVLSEHARALPPELDQDDPRWRVPRHVFDPQRALWLSRTGELRRALN